MTYTATYSPEDNKLRLYASARLDPETYQRVKGAGFAWAPKQDLFAAAWSPGRADLCEELAGEIEDEDRSLVERAEDRAERFEGYSEKRAAESAAAHRAVSAIADHIPMGQPILVGHHSEKHARKDAEKIHNGMAKAVRCWDTARYWEQRAAGAVAAAKYKERPDVRARRIKTIEADLRKRQRSIVDTEQAIRRWELVDNEDPWKVLEDGSKPTREQRAQTIANLCWLTCVDNWTAHDVLKPDGERWGGCPAWTVDQVLEVARKQYPGTLAYYRRWVEHYENRLSYERAMLAESGGTAADRKAPEKGGAVRSWVGGRGANGAWSTVVKVNQISVTLRDTWGNGGADFTRTVPFDKLGAIMTKAEVDEARAAGRMINETTRGFQILEPTAEAPKVAAPEPESPEVEAMRESLRQGVQVVTAPALFPTPAAVVRRMIELADLQPGEPILEPSAGTGAIIKEIIDACDTEIVAYEINPKLCAGLEKFPSYRLKAFCRDFLDVTDYQGCFARVLMNPPFDHGADIKHIRHALTFLKPGGRLVAICANGPRQAAAFRDEAEHWEELDAGTFAGTNVRAAIVVLDVAEVAVPEPISTQTTTQTTTQSVRQLSLF